MGRKSAAVSAVLLAVVTVAVAEAALVAILVLFSSVLKVDLRIELGSFGAMYSTGANRGPVVDLYAPAGVVAVLFTTGSGLATAMWTFRRWRPSA